MADDIFVPQGQYIDGSKLQRDHVICLSRRDNISVAIHESILNFFNPNTGATNSSGFTALPTGIRDLNGSYVNLFISTNYHSTTESSTINVEFRILGNFTEQIARASADKTYGISTRCVKN